jgi:hypothetical protein
MPIVSFLPATLILVFGLRLVYKRREKLGLWRPKNEVDDSEITFTSEEKAKVKFTKKEILFNLLYTVCVTGVLYVVFTKFLGAVLP